VFARGDYVACSTVGPRAEEVLAFVRRSAGTAVLTAVRRFPARAERHRDWSGTTLRVEKGSPAAREILTGRAIDFGGALDPQALFAVLPIAVVEWDERRD
jgi:maltooligosyltrehalose synthase